MRFERKQLLRECLRCQRDGGLGGDAAPCAAVEVNQICTHAVTAEMAVDKKRIVRVQRKNIRTAAKLLGIILAAGDDQPARFQQQQRAADGGGGKTGFFGNHRRSHFTAAFHCLQYQHQIVFSNIERIGHHLHSLCQLAPLLYRIFRRHASNVLFKMKK